MAHLVFKKHYVRRDGVAYHTDKFTSWLDEEQITLPTTRPFFAGAAELIKRGYDPKEKLTASHEHSRIVALQGTIGHVHTLAMDMAEQAGDFTILRPGPAGHPDSDPD